MPLDEHGIALSKVPSGYTVEIEGVPHRVIGPSVAVGGQIKTVANRVAVYFPPDTLVDPDNELADIIRQAELA